MKQISNDAARQNSALVLGESRSIKDSSEPQRLTNLEMPILVRSLKSSNDELCQYFDERLFKCCLSVDASP